MDNTSIALLKRAEGVEQEEKRFWLMTARRLANLGLNTGDGRTSRLEQRAHKPGLRKILEIMQLTQAFYRQKGVTGDDAWPQPLNPLPPKATGLPNKTTQHGVSPLQRLFVSCYNKKLQFAEECVNDSPPDLKLDLAMLLVGPEGRGKDDSMFWRDCRVTMEVKTEDAFDGLLMAQDTAACYVLAPLDCQQCPTKFMELIGRLVSLGPVAFGYDTNFKTPGKAAGPDEDRLHHHTKHRVA
ncbi:hypothetical protein FRB98_004458 [Tulasnella sp. 332]|nr:hypothetical protein FRB98_004458 [Tulasnella sp. 332]